MTPETPAISDENGEMRRMITRRLSESTICRLRSHHRARLRPRQRHPAGGPPGPCFSPATPRVSLGMGYTIMLRLADRVWLATSAEGTVVQLRMGSPEDPRSRRLLRPGEDVARSSVRVDRPSVARKAHNAHTIGTR